MCKSPRKGVLNLTEPDDAMELNNTISFERSFSSSERTLSLPIKNSAMEVADPNSKPKLNFHDLCVDAWIPSSISFTTTSSLISVFISILMEGSSRSMECNPEMQLMQSLELNWIRSVCVFENAQPWIEMQTTNTLNLRTNDTMTWGLIPHVIASAISLRLTYTFRSNDGVCSLFLNPVRFKLVLLITGFGIWQDDRSPLQIEPGANSRILALDYQRTQAGCYLGPGSRYYYLCFLLCHACGGDGTKNCGVEVSHGYRALAPTSTTSVSSSSPPSMILEVQLSKS